MKYISRLAQSIEPYIPGEQPKIEDLIKLNTNENAFPPSPKVIEAVQNGANASLRLYPQSNSDDLRKAIANANNVDMQNVFVGNGSDEVLALSFLAFFNPDEVILFPDITYSFYSVYASLFGIPYELVKLKKDFTLDILGFYNAKGGVIFPNPNAPTSIAIGIEQIEKILKHNDKAVIVDEAYIDFGAQSALPLLEKYDNLLIVRTMSKSHALAGMRVGYAIGNLPMINALKSIKDSFNSYPLDRIAQAAAMAALRDNDYTKKANGKIISIRNDSIKKLEKMGFKCLESKANFIFTEHESMSAKQLQSELKSRAILVRHFDLPRINNYLRITIGTEAQMDRLFYALGDILEVKQ